METNDLVLELANRLGIATEEIFTIFSESIKGIAIVNVMSLVIFFVGLFFVFKLACMFVNKIEYGTDKDTSLTNFDGDDWCHIFILCAIMGLIWMFFMVLVSDCMSQYLFPEYAAIKKMLMLLR